MTEITDPTTRRAVLGGVAAVGAGAVLAACGGGSEAKSTSSASSGSGQSSSGSDDTASGGPLGTTADVPVGGGTVFQKQKIVVTQPTKGDFKAFTAICTHQGCTVGEVDGDTIQCNCHGSQFSAEDGSVKKGPATQALAEKKLSVEGDKLIVS